MIVLAGCISAQQRALNDACDEAKEERVFPENGAVAEIHVRFDLGKGQERISVNEVAVCNYQGSFCPAGEWYDVWHGNQQARREVSLENDRTLTIWHHGLCMNLRAYSKLCVQGDCDALSHFKFRLQLNPEETERRKNECSKRNPSGVTSDPDEFVRCGIPSVDLVTLEKLEAYGYAVTNQMIKVTDDGL